MCHARVPLFSVRVLGALLLEKWTSSFRVLRQILIVFNVIIIINNIITTTTTILLLLLVVVVVVVTVTVTVTNIFMVS